MDIQEIREKYPQYKDLSDEQLATGLHKKYYSDMDFGEFSKKIGFNQQVSEPQQEKFNILKPGGPSKFSDKPDFGSIPVGSPEMGLKAANVPFIPLQMLLRSPGAVSEAGLGERPEGITERGPSILDLAGMAGRGTEKILPGGFMAEDAGGDISMSGDLREKLAKIAVEQGATIPYATGVLKLLGGLGEGLSALKSASIDRDIATAIEKGIEKGIRPSVAGKKTFSQSKRYMDKAKGAVGEIVKNRNNLMLTGENGEIVRELPKNLKQFSQAIEQTKRQIFKQYDTLAKQAGEKGAVVDLTPISKELDSVASNNIVNDINPEIASYANGLSERIKTRGTYTLNEAQDAIATLNNSLESFYKNPTYENANKAYVDSLLANNLRKSLDKSVGSITGEQYQSLKDSYGALKTIEKDVTHRSIVDARKNMKGLLDFSDIFTGYHAVRGIMELNPSMITASTFSKGVAWLYKLKNDPNRIVKNMFSDVEKLISKKQVAPLKEPISIPPKRISWDGIFTRSESGEPVSMWPGTNQPKFNMPDIRRNPIAQIELKRYYEKTNGPVSNLLKPQYGSVKSKIPPKLVTEKQPSKIISKKFEIPERIKKAISEAKRKEALDKINKFRSIKGLKTY